MEDLEDLIITLARLAAISCNFLECLGISVGVALAAVLIVEESISIYHDHKAKRKYGKDIVNHRKAGRKTVRNFE